VVIKDGSHQIKCSGCHAISLNEKEIVYIAEFTFGSSLKSGERNLLNLHKRIDNSIGSVDEVVRSFIRNYYIY